VKETFCVGLVEIQGVQCRISNVFLVVTGKTENYKERKTIQNSKEMV
jgi:hypothetical protein